MTFYHTAVRRIEHESYLFAFSGREPYISHNVSCNFGGHSCLPPHTFLIKNDFIIIVADGAQTKLAGANYISLSSERGTRLVSESVGRAEGRRGRGRGF